MLANSIALITLAVMLGSEAKRADPPWSYGLWTLTTVVALIALALQPIAQALPGLGIFLSAIFGNPLAWFLLFLSLFFVLRPFWSKPRAAAGSPPSDTAQKVSAAQAQILTSFSDRLSGFAEAQASDRALLSNLGGAIEEVRKSVQILEARLVSGNSITADNVAMQFRNVQAALKAIYHRERLHAREQEIRQAGDLLIQPSETGIEVKGSAWEDWLKLEEMWRDKIERWCELAELYSGNVRESVFDTPVAKYRVKWDIKDNQLPDSDAVFSYKTFRIIFANWLSVKDVVEGRVLRAAYDGQANQILKDTEG